MKYFRDPKTSFETELQTHVLDVILAQIELYFEAFWASNSTFSLETIVKNDIFTRPQK